MPKRWVVGGIWAISMTAGMWECVRHAAAEQPTKAVNIYTSSTAVEVGQQTGPEKIIISAVIITGNQRMSTEQVKVRLHTKPGDEYETSVVDNDVRELYKTGQFSNIAAWIRPDGATRAKIYFSVRELPNTVQKVTFIGNKHIKEKDLKDLTGVRESTPLNPNLNRQGCQKILEKYAEMGRSFAECHLIKGGDLADTEVVYQITEGPKYKVSDIQFKGNTFASVEQLKQKIPLQAGGIFHRTKSEAGFNELLTFYRDSGFRDVRISLERRRDSAPGAITLIYHIQEGPRYHIADDSQQ
jgi:outer membrane protein insertion porin family